MSKFHDDNEEWQRALLHHPAIKPGGVDPLWRVSAIVGWIIVLLLTALVARGDGNDTLPAGVRLSSPGTSDHLGALLASKELPALVARGSVITTEFLDAMEQVESGRDAGAVGDKGRARGSFQFWAVAWSQVNTLRKQQGLESLNYYLSTNRAIARSFAVTYLRWLESHFTATLHRTPTHSELFAMWNLGPSGFRARGFSLARCPRRTRSAAQRIENLVRFNAPAGRTNGRHLPAPLLAGAF